jgi:hypothetical protein
MIRTNNFRILFKFSHLHHLSRRSLERMRKPIWTLVRIKLAHLNTIYQRRAIQDYINKIIKMLEICRMISIIWKTKILMIKVKIKNWLKIKNIKQMRMLRKIKLRILLQLQDKKLKKEHIWKKEVKRKNRCLKTQTFQRKKEKRIQNTACINWI